MFQKREESTTATNNKINRRIEKRRYFDTQGARDVAMTSASLHFRGSQGFLRPSRLNYTIFTLRTYKHSNTNRYYLYLYKRKHKRIVSKTL